MVVVEEVGVGVVNLSPETENLQALLVIPEDVVTSLNCLMVNRQSLQSSQNAQTLITNQNVEFKMWFFKHFYF